mgnify:CR=1 FL=1
MSNIRINIDNQDVVTDYYKELDNNIINNLSKLSNENQLIKDFLNLTVKNNIYLFKKRKNKWIFKSDEQLKKDFHTKKKTILRKHADNIIEISKSEMSEVDSNITKLNISLKDDLKIIDHSYKLFKSLRKDNLLNFNDSNFNLKNLTNLNKIPNYSKKFSKNNHKKKKLNELNYIAEYSN